MTVCPATTKVTIGTPDGSTLPTKLEAGQTLELKATGNDGSAQAFTWKSSNKLVTVKDGNVTADPKALGKTVTITADPKAVGKTVTITATAADGTNKSASIKLKIVAPAAPQA